MNPGASLSGREVLVTRPAERAAGLLERIAAAGGRPIPFPVIEIRPRSPDPCPHAASFSIVLFVSPAAVTHGVGPIGLRPDSPVHIGAVGPATADAIEDAGLGCDIRPARADSDGLLAHPALAAERVVGAHILIVRGEGGREDLARGLVERGAAVAYAEVYRRVRPERYDPATAADSDIVTATSVEGLENLLAMVEPTGRERLLRRPLAVAAPRIAEHARSLGFCACIVSAPRPGDDGLMQAVTECAVQSERPSR